MLRKTWASQRLDLNSQVLRAFSNPARTKKTHLIDRLSDRTTDSLDSSTEDLEETGRQGKKVTLHRARIDRKDKTDQDRKTTLASTTSTMFNQHRISTRTSKPTKKEARADSEELAAARLEISVLVAEIEDRLRASAEREAKVVSAEREAKAASAEMAAEVAYAQKAERVTSAAKVAFAEKAAPEIGIEHARLAKLVRIIVSSTGTRVLENLA